MMKRMTALLCMVALVITIAIPATAATNYIATNIPKTFPVVRQDSSFTVVNFWHANTGANSVLLENIANWYNSTTGKKNKIYVKTIFQGDYESIAIKLNAVIQSNKATSLPDLVQLNSTGAFGMKESKYVAIMEDLMKADKNFKMSGKLNKNMTWACSYKGKQVGMPFSCSLIALHYNAGAFKAVGLDPDNPPKTFAEVAEYAKKLMIKGTGKKPVRYGFSTKLAAYHFSTLVPRQNKGTAYQFDQEDGRLGAPTKYLAKENGTLKAILTTWKMLGETGAFDQQGTTTDVKLGKSTMSTGSMIEYTSMKNYFKNLKDKSKVIETRMARIPTINADDAVDEAIGGSSVYMFDKGDDTKKNATWDFVKFLASVDVSAYWYVNSGYFPTNNDAYNTKLVADLWAGDAQYKVMPKVLTDGAKNYKFQSPFCFNLSNLDSTTQNYGILIATGKKTVDEGVKAISDSATKSLETYWRANK